MSEVKHRLMPKFICLFWPKRFIAITLTSKLVCYREEKWKNHEGCRAHEAVHCKQIRENGWLKFMATYIWYSIRHGYHDNPYEIQARSESNFPK